MVEKMEVLQLEAVLVLLELLQELVCKMPIHEINRH